MSNENDIYSNDTFKKLNIQYKIWTLNNFMIVGALTIPIDILNKKNIDDKEKLKQFFIRNNKERFTKGRPLHPNLLRYLNEEGICEPFREKGKKDHYLKSKIDGDDSKIIISKANLFGYELINKFRDNRNFERFFDNKGYFYGLKMELEMPVGYDYENEKKLCRKLDFAFDVGGKEETGKYLSLEFFEAYHENNAKYNSTYEHTRLGELLKMDNNCQADCEKFVSFLVIWDCHWSVNENYKDGWIKIFVDKIKKYDNINNENERISQELDKYIGSIKLSRILVESCLDQKKCVINIDTIFNFWGVNDKKKIIENFKEIIKEITYQPKSIFSKHDDEEKSKTVDKFYYEEENKIFISRDGLSQLIGVISRNDIDKISKYEECKALTGQLQYAAVSAIKELNKLRDNLRKELLIGLDHLYNLPEEFKDKQSKVNENKKQAESGEKISKSKPSNGVCKEKGIRQESSKGEMKENNNINRSKKLKPVRGKQEKEDLNELMNDLKFSFKELNKKILEASKKENKLDDERIKYL